MTIDREENKRVIYVQLCTTYHRLKNFRASLLGLLPLGSGVSAFVTLKEIPQLASIIGYFGLFFTLGLFIYEIHGTVLIQELVKTGKYIEVNLGIQYGQFKNRPNGIGGDFGAISAALIVYISVLCLWGYLICSDINIVEFCSN
ncbi:hypothetical protein [Crocosphaera sp.]|uniref:hypothetical protein n=1 Tax=Crocosphaera sp. TaxID=2729996 RepID=UPI003F1FBB6F